MAHKLRPTLKAMRSRKNELRIGQSTHTFTRKHLTPDKVLNVIDPFVDMHRKPRRNFDPRKPDEGLHPLLCPDVQALWLT